jgi:hypothetical protein
MIFDLSKVMGYGMACLLACLLACCLVSGGASLSFMGFDLDGASGTGRLADGWV